MKITSQKAKLNSTSSNEMFELVCDNGQVLLRGLPGKPRKPSVFVHAKNGEDNFPSKRARFETRDPSLIEESITRKYSLCDKKHHEARLYQTPLNVFSEHSRGNLRDTNFIDFQVVPTNEHANLGPEFATSYVVEIPQMATIRRSQQKYQAPASLKPKVNSTQNPISMGELHNTKLQEQNLKPEAKRVSEIANFPLFRRTQAVIELNGQRSSVTIPGLSRSEYLKSNNNNPIVASPCGDEVPQSRKSSIGTKVELLKQGDKSPDSLPVVPDNQSTNVCHEGAYEKERSKPSHVHCKSSGEGKLNGEKTTENPVAASSFCSRGASNNPIYTKSRTYEDGQELAYPKENVERNPAHAMKPVPAGRSMATKRRRNAEVHNLSERKRREKVNKKILELKELIPRCNKVDKASILDEAIDYLKALQIQLQMQMMSIGNGICMPPMMPPCEMKRIHAPVMNHFSSLGLRNHMGISCNPSPFLFFPIPGAARVPIPMSVVPAPMGFRHEAVPVPGFSHAMTSPMEFMDSAPPPISSNDKQSKF